MWYKIKYKRVQQYAKTICIELWPNLENINKLIWLKVIYINYVWFKTFILDTLLYNYSFQLWHTAFFSKMHYQKFLM